MTCIRFAGVCVDYRPGVSGVFVDGITRIGKGVSVAALRHIGRLYGDEKVAIGQLRRRLRVPRGAVCR